MSNKIEKLTAGLVTPTCKKEFTNANGKEWARRIIVDYMKKSDPDWLLASVLKVLDVVVKDNTSPGKQRRFGHAATDRQHAYMSDREVQRLMDHNPVEGICAQVYTVNCPVASCSPSRCWHSPIDFTMTIGYRRGPVHSVRDSGDG